MCLPTAQVLVEPDVQRCMSDSDCSSQAGAVCVSPYTPSIAGQIVRIYTKHPPWMGGAENAFVFEGELVDIWESGKYSNMIESARVHLLKLLENKKQSK